MQQENFENGDEQDLGRLVSEKVTVSGFLQALFDIMFMGMFLAGSMSCIFLSTRLIGLEWCVAGAIGLLLFEKWIQDLLASITSVDVLPEIRVFEKDGKTITIVE